MTYEDIEMRPLHKASFWIRLRWAAELLFKGTMTMGPCTVALRHPPTVTP